MTPQTFLPPPQSLADEGWLSSALDGAGVPVRLAVNELGAALAVPDQLLFSVTAAADARTVSGLRRETYRRFQRWGLDEESCSLMQLAFAELGANVIEHGSPAKNACMQITWAVQRVPGQLSRAVVSVLDAGDGVSRRGADPDLTDADDVLPLIPTGERGLRLLLRSGLRIDRIMLPAMAGWPSGHLVSAWSPLDVRERRRVCACPCWEHGNAIARCQQIVAGGRYRLRRVSGESIACCRSCAVALRTAASRTCALDDVRTAASETALLIAQLGEQAARLSDAIVEARRLDVPADDVAALLDGLGASDDLLEIVRTDSDGSKLLWQLAAALAVPDEPGVSGYATAVRRGDLLGLPV